MITIFYAFRDEVESIGIQEARSCDFVIGYISVAELNDVAGLFDLPKTVPSTVSVGISNACAVFRLEECTMYIKTSIPRLLYFIKYNIQSRIIICWMWCIW